MHHLLVLVAAFLLTACEERPAQSSLFVDANGFVFGSDSHPITVRVGAGTSADQFLAQNPMLNGKVWVPRSGHPFDEMRLALQTRTTLIYDDGTLRFTVCAHSASIDGNATLKNGVASVGFILCDPPLDDVETAIAQASQILDLLRNAGPAVQDFGGFYRTASQAQLAKRGGKRWERLATQHFAGLPPPRDDPASMEHLKTLEEAKAHLLSHKVDGRATRGGDGRISGGNVLLGVFVTDKVIVEVGISGSGAFGGENLTFAQQNAIRYQAGASIRLRSPE